MLLSQSCMHGIRAALLVSARSNDDQGKYYHIRQVSSELAVSFHFLTKILQVLTGAKIMESYKGPNGGVRLARPPESIFLIDIVRAVDGTETFTGCIIGLPDCDDSQPCPLNRQCGTAMSQLQQMLETTSLAKLARETEKFGYRL